MSSHQTFWSVITERRRSGSTVISEEFGLNQLGMLARFDNTVAERITGTDREIARVTYQACRFKNDPTVSDIINLMGHSVNNELIDRSLIHSWKYGDPSPEVKRL